MATKEDNTKPSDPGVSDEDATAIAPAGEDSTTVEFDGPVAAPIGTEKYVHAAFMVAGVLVVYLVTQILASIWHTLAEWPAAVRAIPALLSYAEDERTSYTVIVGAIVGVVAVLVALRNAAVRKWADEVASELYKVHWPDREVVTNGTIVVIVAGIFATLYIGLLDRLWNFVTNLVYGI